MVCSYIIATMSVFQGEDKMITVSSLEKIEFGDQVLQYGIFNFFILYVILDEIVYIVWVVRCEAERCAIQIYPIGLQIALQQDE